MLPLPLRGLRGWGLGFPKRASGILGEVGTLALTNHFGLL